MKKPHGFKIVSATLIALIVAIVLHRFTYSAFSMAKTGQVFWYNWDLWKQYYAWIPGKILCIANLSLIILLIIESLWMICRNRVK
ncbi:MAG: hypothetical protein J6S19_01685 [Lentisphaeria bacterium]|nr:hypothetical protein [Lentisphaeria bacterium]